MHPNYKPNSDTRRVLLMKCAAKAPELLAERLSKSLVVRCHPFRNQDMIRMSLKEGIAATPSETVASRYSGE